MTPLDCVERAIVLMERYSAAMRMVERYGNEHGDRDMCRQCLDQMKSLIQELAQRQPNDNRQIR